MNDGKRISETLFRRLVARLSPEQLRQLPLDSLPASIPLDVVDEDLEPQKYEALNQLAWAIGARELERRCEAGDRLAGPVRDALETAEAADARGVPELDRLTELVARAWHAGDFRCDALSTPTQALERARVRAADLARDVGALHRALAVLDRGFAGEGTLLERVSAARLHAKKVLRAKEAALGRQELLEIDIAQGDMRVRQQQCDLELSRYRELDEQIQAIEEKLRRQRRTVRRLISPRLARRQREYLVERLDTLMRKRDSIESFVSEEDLMHWLDVLVNATLHVPKEQWRQRAQRTRLLLYRLLNVYCLQQETAAQQVALRAVPGVNAKEAIGYYLQSEQFILSYFARKKQEVTLWLAGAADERLTRLNQVRDAILADYRRHAQRARREPEALSSAAADTGVDFGRQQTA